MTLYQLYEIFSKYYAAETSSSVKLGYASLDFPSVTFCNLNPIRKSHLDLTPQSFQDFLLDLSADDTSDEKFKNVTVPPGRRNTVSI